MLCLLNSIILQLQNVYRIIFVRNYIYINSLSLKRLCSGKLCMSNFQLWIRAFVGAVVVEGSVSKSRHRNFKTDNLCLLKSIRVSIDLKKNVC